MPKSAPVSRPLKVISKEVNTKRLKRKLSEAYENNENLRKELAELKDKHTKLQETHSKLGVRYEVTDDLYDTYSHMYLQMRREVDDHCCCTNVIEDYDSI